jgi:hypothetical protein
MIVFWVQLAGYFTPTEPMYYEFRYDVMQLNYEQSTVVTDDGGTFYTISHLTIELSCHVDGWN